MEDVIKPYCSDQYINAFVDSLKLTSLNCLKLSS